MTAGKVAGWLALGVACGLALGFVAGLTRPRHNQQVVGPMGTPEDGTT